MPSSYRPEEARKPGRGRTAAVLSEDAPKEYAVARARAKKAGRLLAGESDGKAEAASLPAFLASREASADSLAELILSSGVGQKASTGLEKFLGAKSKDLATLFPEAADVAAVLLKAGAAGAREAAAAMAHRGPGDIARSLIASKERIVALAPSAAISLTKLEASFEAYSAMGELRTGGRLSGRPRVGVGR